LQEIDIHDPSGIRIHNPSKQAAANPRLKDRGSSTTTTTTTTIIIIIIIITANQSRRMRLVGAWGFLERGRRDAEGHYGGKPAGRDHTVRQSSNYAVKISSKTSLNLVLKFEVNTPRIVPHNSNRNFSVRW